MALATLGDAPVTPEELAVWSFVHAAHHRDILRIIYQNSLIVLEEFVLDPFDPHDLSSWTYKHQFMHQQMDAVLGIAGFDLSQLNWADTEMLNNWMNSHQTEHEQAGQILGIG